MADFDDKDWQKRLGEFAERARQAVATAVKEVAHEALRLSQIEVPKRLGLLSQSGQVEPGNEEAEQIVGYNKVYAARLHEHPEYRFSRAVNPNAKGKYLEDPVKQNIKVFNQHVQDAYNKSIG